MSWSSRVKKEGIFSKKICVLWQCVVYWMPFQNIHTFTYQKWLLHSLLLLAFEIVESLQCILNFIFRISSNYVILYEYFCFNTNSSVKPNRQSEGCQGDFSQSYTCLNILNLTIRNCFFSRTWGSFSEIGRTKTGMLKNLDCFVLLQVQNKDKFSQKEK